jgi:hypothetical protein
MMYVSKLSALAFMTLSQGIMCKDMPSCETDIAAHCLGDGTDMSQSGIAACLATLAEADRSALCNEYMSVIDECATEIGKG